MRYQSKSRGSVVLASASYAGTLAAVRELGANGIKVSVMSGTRIDARWSPRMFAAAWSRFCACSYRSPPEHDHERFMNALLAVGAINPGQVLLPTSDETAWLYSINAKKLAEHFIVYQPSVATLRQILDKQQLADAARAAGVATVPTWEARSAAELAALAPGLPYPILIKPRTQVMRLRSDKGVRVNTPAELLKEYPRFVERESRGAGGNPSMPDAGLPILQQFIQIAAEGVCSISGFVDRSGELFVTRRSKKILQRSPPAGVGICFESLPHDPQLSDAVRRLCRELRYFGIFEVEFLNCNGTWAVNDFNPRMFNQIGMDIRRGMPLPLLAWLDAAGEAAALRAAVAAAHARTDAVSTTVFCDRFQLWVMLASRFMTGRISRTEMARWRTWIRVNAVNCVDAASFEGDPMPRIIHVASEIFSGLGAVRRFLYPRRRMA